MNILNSFKKFFFKIDDLVFNSFARKKYNFIKYNIKLFFVIFFKEKKIYSKDHGLKKKLIISLTSYPGRFRTLPLVLNSIQKQSIKADKIILWIDKKDKKKLPSSVLDFKGINIKYCENNLLSYKKIIPTLRLFKNHFIITLDDDVIYSDESIEKLVKQSKAYPNDVISNCTHKIKIKNSLPAKYKLWHHNYKKLSRYAYFTGTGGVLYPPNCFYKDVLKIKIFKKLAPFGDDIWLNWMVKLKRKKIRFSLIKQNLDGMGYEDIKIIRDGLYKKNVKQNYNDTQIRNMIKKYGFPF